MVEVDVIELSFKRIPQYNSELAKTVTSNSKKTYLIGSSIAAGFGLCLFLFTSQGFTKLVGGGLAVGGLGVSAHTLTRKTDDSSEAKEERIKFGIAENIRKAKSVVESERKQLTDAAHQMHSFRFDTTNTINDEITFNCYTVQVTDRPDCVNVGFRTDKVLYRTETRTEFYTTKKGKVKTRQRKVKVPDRVKFTIAFPDRKRAIKGVMGCYSYDQMIALYNARHQKAQDLAAFHQRYAIAEENVRKNGDQIYFSSGEKRAIEHAKELERFDSLLNEIGQEIPVEIDESQFAEFDQLLGLDALSSSSDIEELEDGDEVESSESEELEDSSDEEQQFTEAELREIGLPAIRQQFNITARSYAEAFTKLREKGIIVLSN